MASAADRSSMDIDSPASPSQNTNGVNGAQTDRTPTPPPHKSNGSVAEADSFKLAGNKFFKDGNYNRAIEEFTKGEYALLCRKFTRLIG
jgi:DnaJ family protein C protein 7